MGLYKYIFQKETSRSTFGKCFEKLRGILKDNQIKDTIDFFNPSKRADDNIDESIRKFCDKINANNINN